MTAFHQQLANGRWHTLSLFEQMAHIGTEVERALNWQTKADPAAAQAAFYRALDLIDLSLGDPKYHGKYKELTRMREVVCDYFTNQRLYHSSPQSIRRYFEPFFWAVAKDR